MNLADAIADWEGMQKEDLWVDYDDEVQKDAATPNQASFFCFHAWKPTLLIYSTVWDCKFCGAKKEVVERAIDSDDTMW